MRYQRGKVTVTRKLLRNRKFIGQSSFVFKRHLKLNSWEYSDRREAEETKGKEKNLEASLPSNLLGFRSKVIQNDGSLTF